MHELGPIDSFQPPKVLPPRSVDRGRSPQRPVRSQPQPDFDGRLCAPPWPAI